MARIKLSAPWVLFYHEVQAFFAGDPEVKVVFNEDEYELKLYVDNPMKADALEKLLPTEKVWGNITLKIMVVPANGTSSSKGNLIKYALEGNPALSYIQVIKGIFSNDITYVVFINQVVQYFTDDLFDVNGLRSTLYQEIAKDIFGEVSGVYYCTDLPNEERTGSLGAPLGEWP